MTPRVRVLALVALAAAVTVAAVVGITAWQTRGETTAQAGAVTGPRAGTPPLELDFGVRADPEAQALARAQRLYNAGKVARAAPIFARYRSLEAQIGSAFAGWKDGRGLDVLKRLVASHPRSGAAELHLGWAYYWAGRTADAVAAWRRTAEVARDSFYGVAAEDALHPGMPIPGLPPIVTTLKAPASTRPAAEQLAALAAAARRPDANAKLLYGLALWNLRRPVSAERQFAAAAKLAPHDPVARTAAAVGAFTKANPVKAFGKLGPLTAVFPGSPVVELHLGLLLLWIDDRKKAETHLRAAVADGPQTAYAKNARVLLASLAKNRTR